jgi:Cd(II)/Pb(II)-responsive transcriptional regulator
LKIGDLAKSAATPVETIRYYERRGLLPAPSRTAANYRHYNSDHLHRLLIIRRCRALDMTLDEISALLGLMDGPTANCSGVDTLVDEHIEHVKQRIEELQALHTQLCALRGRCNVPGPGRDCGIVATLQARSNAEPPGTAHVRGAHKSARRTS